MFYWFLIGLFLYGLLRLYRLLIPKRRYEDADSVQSVLRPLAVVAIRSDYFYYPPSISGVTKISVADAWRERRLLNHRRRRRRVLCQPKYHHLRFI